MEIITRNEKNLYIGIDVVMPKMLEKSLFYSSLKNICLNDYPIIKDFYFGRNG